MKRPEFDRYGYPTDRTLRAIAQWPSEDFKGLMDFVESAWKYPDYWVQHGQEICASTGGWSGNESLIEALSENRVFWLMCWMQSRRGGHYIFVLPKE